MTNTETIAEKYINRLINKGIYLTAYNKSYIRSFAKYLQENITEPVKTELKIQKNITGKRIALITEDVGHLTGGRYYCYFIAMALVEVGYDVTIYTNMKPVFFQNFSKYKQPKIKIIGNAARDLEQFDVEADAYIGSPISGDIAAVRLGKKYNKPSFAIIFDPFPMMAKYLGSRFYPGWSNLIQEIRKSDCSVISLCDETSKYIYEWLDKRPEKVIPIYPCINSLEPTVHKNEKSDYVVFISRLVKHKKFEDVLYAVKNAGIRLKVIASIDGMKTQKMVEEMGMTDIVDYHMKISDKEKFDIISKSRGVINGAIFEGFGLWAAEAVAYGIPVICYDFPTIREIANHASADNFYFAKWNDKEDLKNKLQQALKENKFSKPNDIFNFKSMVERVRKVFDYKPKIGVVMIAINEEQYIGASLRALIRHDNIRKIAVVEGAVNLYPSATSKGLSIDKTSSEIMEAMKEKNGDKIIYERYGHALNKEELRNRALSLLTDVDYILMVDADEVWEQEQLDKLVNEMYQNPDKGVIRFGFYHFWKRPDLIATGSQWDSKMFRCFKYIDKSLHWQSHEKPVVNYADVSITESGEVVANDIHVHHYGYLKDEKNILDKLEYYKRRDKNLVVTNTWSNWKEGLPTQPTHGSGTVQKFMGTHPIEVKNII